MNYYNVTVTYQIRDYTGTLTQETFTCVRKASKASYAINAVSALFGALSNSDVRTQGTDDWNPNIIILSVSASKITYN